MPGHKSFTSFHAICGEPLARPFTGAPGGAIFAPPYRGRARIAAAVRTLFFKYPTPPEGCRTPVPEFVPDPPDPELAATWNGVRTELRAEVPDYTFHIWLDPLELAARRRARLFVRAPDHIRTWVEERYLALLTAAAIRVIGRDAEIEVVSADWRDDQPASSPGTTPPARRPPASTRPATAR